MTHIFMIEDRQLATILAALRFYQAERERALALVEDVATDAGKFAPLGNEEIDHLFAYLSHGEYQP